MNDAIKLTIIATSVIGAMVVIWSGVIIPEFEKLPNDYSFYMAYDGEDKIAPSVDPTLSETDRPLGVSEVEPPIDDLSEWPAESGVDPVAGG